MHFYQGAHGLSVQHQHSENTLTYRFIAAIRNQELIPQRWSNDQLQWAAIFWVVYFGHRIGISGLVFKQTHVNPYNMVGFSWCAQNSFTLLNSVLQVTNGDKPWLPPEASSKAHRHKRSAWQLQAKRYPQQGQDLAPWVGWVGCDAAAAASMFTILNIPC